MTDISQFQTLTTQNSESYAAEVIKCLTEMREQRQRLSGEISGINNEKRKLEAGVRQLTNKLAKLNYRLAQKTHFDNELRKTIENAETAYAKLVESSQILYQSIKQTKDNLVDQSGEGNETKLDIGQFNKDSLVQATTTGITHTSKSKK